MRIHHLNCGCMCPVGGRLWDGVSRGPTAQLVCHCLLVETDSSGLVLVDTGFGSRDVEDPYGRLSPLFIHMNRIRLEHRYTALAEVTSRGFSPRDVRHIVLTHLDFDHAGGLEDFPEATVHVLQPEAEAAERRDGFIRRRRYRPEQWDEVGHWSFYDRGGERWFGFDAVRGLAEAGGYDDAAWSELCELGWPGIFIDEELGGQGLGTVELVILMEELGYTLAPLPFLSNAAAGLVIAAGGSDEQKERWLPGIASGAAPMDAPWTVRRVWPVARSKSGASRR